MPCSSPCTTMHTEKHDPGIEEDSNIQMSPSFTGSLVPAHKTATHSTAPATAANTAVQATACQTDIHQCRKTGHRRLTVSKWCSWAISVLKKLWFNHAKLVQSSTHSWEYLRMKNKITALYTRGLYYETNIYFENLEKYNHIYCLLQMFFYFDFLPVNIKFYHRKTEAVMIFCIYSFVFSGLK